MASGSLRCVPISIFLSISCVQFRMKSYHQYISYYCSEKLVIKRKPLAIRFTFSRFAIEVPGYPFYINLQKWAFLSPFAARNVLGLFFSYVLTKICQCYVSCRRSRGRERRGSVVESCSLQLLIHCGGCGDDGDKNANIWGARSRVSVSIPTNSKVIQGITVDIFKCKFLNGNQRFFYSSVTEYCS